MKNRILFIFPFFLTLLILLISSARLFAQKKSIHADYAENILLAKLKPETATLFNTSDFIERIKNVIAPVALIDYSKTFPGIQAPTTEGHVDLSLIHTLTFSGVQKTDLAALAATLMTLESFEYVELKYIHNQQSIFYPNDPNVPIYQQNYLGRMGAFKAWAIEQGNPNVVIGIIDTGSDQNHVDLTNNIAYNTLDPINGVDDDNDGYIDNYSGWDFGNNDNNPTVGSASNHGAKVSGIAGATSNNGIGGAGMGFNSKILPIKASADAGGGGAIIKGYEGIVYAADHGCKVINLSWGGTGNYSPFDQDIINYAAINKDVLIVAAAGNTDEEADYYPAAYENVLSVIAMDTIFSATANQYIDTRANFTNWACCYKATYARSVDIGAQGMGIFTTIPTNTYILQDGSSAASPLVAGAAALVRSHYPNISALQAAELLRVTSDVVDTFPENAPYKEKMGKGRINIYKALTDTKSPSIRFKNITVQSKNSTFLFNGDTVFITADFFNYLRPTAGLIIDLSSPSSDIEILLNSISMGVIDSLASKSNAASPLKFVVKNSATSNQIIELRIGYTDVATGYVDYQYFNIQVNPAYTTLYNDHVKTTITSNGRVGYEDIYSTVGVGFTSNGTNVLYEGGLMIGQNSTTVSDCVRSEPSGNSNLDFKPLNTPAFVNNSIKYRETYSKFNDSSLTNALPQGIECLQRSYTFNTTELSNTVFLEYKIINRSNADIDSIYVGHFVDWDIQNYTKNRAWFDYDSRMGYAYDITANNLYAGLSLLTNQEMHYYAMDNSNVGGSNINPNDGYTKAEKFKCLSSETGRYVAGGNASGNDISMSLAGRINHFKQGDTVVVAFALLTSHTSLLDLKLQSAAAIQKFIEIHTGPTPKADSVKLCTNATSDFTISPSPGTLFNFYTEIPTSASVPIFIGKSYTHTNVSAADTIYITNADSLYESSYARFVVLEDKAPVAAFSYTADVANAASLFTNESIRYQSVLWNFGDNQTSTEENPTHVYTIPGDYIVTLKSSDEETCIDSLKQTITIVSEALARTSANNTAVNIFPIPTDEIITLEFQQSDNASIDILIFNAMGQQVMYKNQIPVMNNQVRLSVASLETGLYFIQIKNMTSQLRFVKQ